MRNLPISLIKDKLYFINYIVYTNQDEEIQYMYLAVRHDNLDGFKEAIKIGTFEAEDYGLILESGKGHACEDVKMKMKLLYNCTEDDNISVIDFNIIKDDEDNFL